MKLAEESEGLQVTRLTVRVESPCLSDILRRSRSLIARKYLRSIRP